MTEPKPTYPPAPLSQSQRVGLAAFVAACKRVEVLCKGDDMLTSQVSRARLMAEQRGGVGSGGVLPESGAAAREPDTAQRLVTNWQCQNCGRIVSSGETHTCRKG